MPIICHYQPPHHASNHSGGQIEVYILETWTRKTFLEAQQAQIIALGNDNVSTCESWGVVIKGLGNFCRSLGTQHNLTSTSTGQEVLQSPDCLPYQILKKSVEWIYREKRHILLNVGFINTNNSEILIGVLYYKFFHQYWASNLITLIFSSSFRCLQ